MNTNNNLIANPFSGNNEIEALRDLYVFAGLPPSNALEAAIADYEDLCSSRAA